MLGEFFDVLMLDLTFFLAKNPFYFFFNNITYINSLFFLPGSTSLKQQNFFILFFP